MSDSLFVAVRVRPLLSNDPSKTHCSCTTVNKNSISIRKCGDGISFLKSQATATTEFAFDAVFDENADQQDVYERSAMPYIQHVAKGKSVTVFAYGATGAGKTHTMLGTARSEILQSKEGFGIIPRAVFDLFSHTSMSTEDITISLSYLEVYNEQVFDLLELSAKSLAVREDQEKCKVVVAGLAEKAVNSPEDVLTWISTGNKNRKTEATGANLVSSRSHAVIQLIVRRKTVSNEMMDSLVESKLCLIDLAGSERASVTNNRGVRLVEGSNINKSLLALANCINALSENANNSNGKKLNVKYRDSKLTLLLKNSLEGRSHVVMIANVNPSEANAEDSHNTLKYASRAKFIKIAPEIASTGSTGRGSRQMDKELQEKTLALEKFQGAYLRLRMRLLSRCTEENTELAKAVCSYLDDMDSEIVLPDTMQVTNDATTPDSDKDLSMISESTVEQDQLPQPTGSTGETIEGNEKPALLPPTKCNDSPQLIAVATRRPSTSALKEVSARGQPTSTRGGLRTVSAGSASASTISNRRKSLGVPSAEASSSRVTRRSSINFANITEKPIAILDETQQSDLKSTTKTKSAVVVEAALINSSNSSSSIVTPNPSGVSSRTRRKSIATVTAMLNSLTSCSVLEISTKDIENRKRPAQVCENVTSEPEGGKLESKKLKVVHEPVFSPPPHVWLDI